MGALRKVLHLAIGDLHGAGDARRGEGSGDTGFSVIWPRTRAAGGQKRVEDRCPPILGVEVERAGPADRRPPGQREARRRSADLDPCRFAGQVGVRSVCRRQGAARTGS
jgi:hypothetical protein